MTSGAIWKTEKGVYIRFVVRPNSRENDFVREVTSDYIQVNISSPARKGKANTELIKTLAKILGHSTSQIILVGGHKSREKIIFIEDIKIENVLSALKL